MMTNMMVISAIGEDKPGIVNELTKTILDTGCNVLDSRMTVLGGEFAVILLIEGNWNTLAKLESSLSTVGDRLGLTLSLKRTEKRDARPNLMPYAIEVVAIDHPGIVNKLAGFFSSRNINIEDLRTDCYAAPHTGTTMFTLNMVVGIPSNEHIAQLREQFLSFCDEFNLDAVLEPVKS